MSDTTLLRIVHLDDNPFEIDRVKSALKENVLNVGFFLESYLTGESLVKRLSQSPEPDVILLDVDLGAGLDEGALVAKHARRLLPDTTIVMCSAVDDATTISGCLGAGADDFISKKSDKGELGLRIFQSYRLSCFKRGKSGKLTQQTSEARKNQPSFAGETLQKISARVPRILESAITAVHVCGESGSGKEVVSEIIESHLQTNKPFIRVNCGAISPTLLESELFGHAKGAFTGATSDKKGYIETASGGWIFLDEIATLSAPAQVSLLRVIENQELIRVGDNTPRKVEIKVLSATNEKLEELVKAGKFRKDLWQRLRETEISIPPLRDRTREIPAIVEHFCKTMNGGPYKISAPALEVLCAAPWREGNIRELRNCLRAMTELNVDKLLTPLAIPTRVWDAIGEPQDAVSENASTATLVNDARTIVLKLTADEPFSFDLLSDKLLLELTKKFSERGKISLRSLAREIGISRSTLSGRLKSLVQNQLISINDLSAMVGINEV